RISAEQLRDDDPDEDVVEEAAVALPALEDHNSAPETEATDKATTETTPAAAAKEAPAAKEAAAAKAAAAARKKKIRELKAVLRRLSTIADDAYQFQQDTGAYVLFLGYPLLSIPPSSLGMGKSPRVLAPLAFMPISVVTGKGS